jgi:hypothetical protein
LHNSTETERSSCTFSTGSCFRRTVERTDERERGTAKRQESSKLLDVSTRKNHAPDTTGPSRGWGCRSPPAAPGPARLRPLSHNKFLGATRRAPRLISIVRVLNAACRAAMCVCSLEKSCLEPQARPVVCTRHPPGPVCHACAHSVDARMRARSAGLLSANPACVPRPRHYA